MQNIIFPAGTAKNGLPRRQTRAPSSNISNILIQLAHWHGDPATIFNTSLAHLIGLVSNPFKLCAMLGKDNVGHHKWKD